MIVVAKTLRHLRARSAAEECTRSGQKSAESSIYRRLELTHVCQPVANFEPGLPGWLCAASLPWLS